MTGPANREAPSEIRQFGTYVGDLKSPGLDRNGGVYGCRYGDHGLLLEGSGAVHGFLLLFFGAFIDHGVDLEIFYEHEAE
jgi:hypothetical protein